MSLLNYFPDLGILYYILVFEIKYISNSKYF